MGLVSFFKKAFVTLQLMKAGPERGKFIRLNGSRRCLANVGPAGGNGCVLVDGFVNIPTHLTQVGRVARALKAKYGFESIVLLNNFSKHIDPYTRLYESYDINKFIPLKAKLLNPKLHLRARVALRQLLPSLNTPQDLLSLEFEGILIGDLVYDTYINCNPGSYTVRAIDGKIATCLLQALKLLFTYKDLLDQHPVRRVVLGDKEYLTYGLLYRLALARGIQAIVCGGPRMKICEPKSIRSSFFHPDMGLEAIKRSLENPDYVHEVDQILATRFGGGDGQKDAAYAYKDKKCYAREELNDLLTLDPAKPNVFILPHAFSDAPHNSSYLVFPDFYCWFVETMGQLQNLDNANWIVKPHPASYVYGEEGMVEAYLRNHCITKVRVAPPDFSPASMVACADTILTVQGTAGLEYACMGVPVITCGAGFYSGYGFTHDAKDPASYRALLATIQNLRPLAEVQKANAKALFYYVFRQTILDPDLPKDFILPNVLMKIDERRQQEEKNFFLINAKLASSDEDGYYRKIYNML